MQNQPPHAESSQASPFEYALRQLWGSRAAIGSGGKKARPFWRRKKVSTGARTVDGVSCPTKLRATLRAPPAKWAIKGFFPAGERSELSRREAWPQWGLGRSPKRPAGRVGGEQSDRQGAMRHRTPRVRGQPLRAVCSRNVIRLFRPLGRNWTTRIYSGRPTVRFPQTEAHGQGRPKAD